MTTEKLTTTITYVEQEDGDILFAAPRHKPVLPAFVVAPDMVIGFPDLTDADVDGILGAVAVDDQAEYDSGRTAVDVDDLEGLALMGYLDMADERELREQTTRGQYR